jgi:hypothetical protein
MGHHRLLVVLPAQSCSPGPPDLLWLCRVETLYWHVCTMQCFTQTLGCCTDAGMLYTRASVNSCPKDMLLGALRPWTTQQLPRQKIMATTEMMRWESAPPSRQALKCNTQVCLVVVVGDQGFRCEAGSCSKEGSYSWSLVSARGRQRCKQSRGCPVCYLLGLMTPWYRCRVIVAHISLYLVRIALSIFVL